MRRTRIFWGFLGYFAGIGLLAGGLLGLLYGGLLFDGDGALFAAMVGAPLGLGAGAVNGIVLAALTIAFFNPLGSLAGAAYRRKMHAISTLLTAAICAIVMVVIFQGTLEEYEILLLALIVPTVIAALAVNVATFLSTGWYVRRSPA